MRKASTIKIGKKLQTIRKSNGYTQEQLAEKVEVSVRYISDVEQDRAKPQALLRTSKRWILSPKQMHTQPAAGYPTTEQTPV